jgi:hypothetical protein
MPKNVPDKNLLSQKYIEERLGYSQLGEFFHCDKKTIGYYIKKFGLTKKTARHAVLTKELLIEEYVNQKNRIHEIATKYSCGRTTISNKLKEYDIKIRNRSLGHIKDIIGLKFGKLTVIEFSHTQGKSKHKNAHWKCICECGRKKIVNGNWLKKEDGSPKSCGCSYHYLGGKYITGAEFCLIKKQANNRNIPFNLTVEDIELIYELQDKKCRFTGYDVKFNSRKAYTNGQIILGDASIDRIDSSKGYTKDNIQIVHKDVNIAKSNKTDKDFIAMCGRISEHNKNEIESYD